MVNKNDLGYIYYIKERNIAKKKKFLILMNTPYIQIIFFL